MCPVVNNLQHDSKRKHPATCVQGYTSWLTDCDWLWIITLWNGHFSGNGKFLFATATLQLYLRISQKMDTDNDSMMTANNNITNSESLGIRFTESEAQLHPTYITQAHISHNNIYNHPSLTFYMENTDRNKLNFTDEISQCSSCDINTFKHYDTVKSRSMCYTNN